MDEADNFEDLLLFSGRNGDHKMLKETLQACLEKNIPVNINCKGKSKSNFGWTPLHLACYFGHTACVKVLLQHDVDIEARNDAGDTPLHKAALTDREDIVLLLLQNGASVHSVNGEGQKASSLPRNHQVKTLIEAAEKTEQRCKEERFLHAVREGNAEDVIRLMKENTLNMNCTDVHGNTGLHCAALRGHVDVAVVLMQNGCDSSAKNVNGQTALELATTAKMKKVLEVTPLRSFHHGVSRFEGPLLRRMRLVGWKILWAVLERGVMTFFANRADASSGVRRRDFKYLDNAQVVPLVGSEGTIFTIEYHDGTSHRLAAMSDTVHSSAVNRQKWLAALSSHIRFSTHYVQTGFSIDVDNDLTEEKTILPLGSMQDVMETASAHNQLLDEQVEEVTKTLSNLQLEPDMTGIRNLLQNFIKLVGTAKSMTSSLDHCFNLMKQQEEVRELQLKEEREKVRVLEESLRILATQHHCLEESIASHLSPRVSLSRVSAAERRSQASHHMSKRTIDMLSSDEYFDAFSLGDEDDVDDPPTLSPGSPTVSETSNTLVSCLSSLPVDPQSSVCDTCPTSPVADFWLNSTVGDLCAGGTVGDLCVNGTVGDLCVNGTVGDLSANCTVAEHCTTSPSIPDDTWHSVNNTDVTSDKVIDGRTFIYSKSSSDISDCNSPGWSDAPAKEEESKSVQDSQYNSVCGDM